MTKAEFAQRCFIQKWDQIYDPHWLVVINDQADRLSAAGYFFDDDCHELPLLPESAFE